MIRPLIAFLGAVLLATPALAGPPVAGDAEVFVELGFTPFATDYFTAGTYTQGGNTAVIALSPDASITLTAQGSALYPATNSSRVIARVTYDYVVLLAQIANAPQRIDGLVDVAGSYALSIQSASPSGYASIGAATATDRNLFFSQPDGDVFNRSLYAGSDSAAYAITGPGLLVDSAYSYNGTMWLAYRGSLKLAASLNPTAPASAMIDPTITINQATLQAAGLEAHGIILLSSGVGMSATPEPAQWALLIGGFGLVGGATRRRRAIYEGRRDPDAASAVKAYR